MHMGSVRVHVVLAAEERARYRAAAKRQGQNLSEWLRAAAEEKLEGGQDALRTADDLDAFFAELDAARRDDAGTEPDWHVLGEEFSDRVSPANPHA